MNFINFINLNIIFVIKITMKFDESLFDEYISSNNTYNLHKKIDFTKIENIRELPNIIIYGPPGIGKYTQSLKIINQAIVPK